MRSCWVSNSQKPYIWKGYCAGWDFRIRKQHQAQCWSLSLLHLMWRKTNHLVMVNSISRWLGLCCNWNYVCNFVHTGSSSHPGTLPECFYHIMSSSNETHVTLPTWYWWSRLVYWQRSVHLNTFVDSHFAGDTTDRKSLSGYLIKLGPCPCFSGARKQCSVAMSTGEAEYYKFVKEAQGILWISSMLWECGIVVGNSVPIRVSKSKAAWMVPTNGRRSGVGEQR